MRSKTAKKKINIEITATWGNGDAHSTIKLTPGKWKKIISGEDYETSAYSYYEGFRSTVSWNFKNGKVSVIGGDGLECLIDDPITSLSVFLNQ